MANVTLPTPVFAAGGAACLLAGFFAGSLLAPASPDSATAEVASYDRGNSQLCLTGDAVSKMDDLNDDGDLCGVWRRTTGAHAPRVGDKFKFVVVTNSGEANGEKKHSTVIYGDVVQ